MTDRTGLSPEEIRQYHRQLSLPELGLEGQQTLKEASVLIVGAGGLGAPLALYLAAAGVGHLGLVDFDVVDTTNLHRQVLYHTADVGTQKVDSARHKLSSRNPHISIETFPYKLSSANAEQLISRYDVVADGTDNFPTRYLINDACLLTQTPNVYGSIYQFEGQISVFCTAEGPCYRCLYPTPPPPDLVPSCAEGGVLGVLPGIIGCLQANEVIKLLLGIGAPLVGRMLLMDALGASFQSLTLRRDAACIACGDHSTITSLMDYEEFCGLGDDKIPEISPETLHTMRTPQHACVVVDVRHAFEAEIASMGADILIPLPELQLRLFELENYRGHSDSGALPLRDTLQKGGTHSPQERVLPSHESCRRDCRLGAINRSQHVSDGIRNGIVHTLRLTGYGDILELYPLPLPCTTSPLKTIITQVGPSPRRPRSSNFSKRWTG